jgi:hypothetical protein
MFQSGDSTLRDVYYQFLLLLAGDASFGSVITDPALLAHRQLIRHAPQSHDVERNGHRVRVSFEWSPFVRNVTADLLTTLDAHPERKPDLIFLSAGPWDLLYDGGVSRAQRTSGLESLAQSLAAEMLFRGWRMKPAVRQKRLQQQQPSEKAKNQKPQEDAPFSLVRGPDPGLGYADWEPTIPTLVWLSSPALLDDRLTKHRKANPRFRDANLVELNKDIAHTLVGQLPVSWADIHAMTARRQPARDEDDGVHSMWSASHTATAMGTFLRCLYPPVPPASSQDPPMSSVPVKDRK